VIRAGHPLEFPADPKASLVVESFFPLPFPSAVR
jgi:hypothetical protein